MIRVRDVVKALAIEETEKTELQKLITRNERIFYVVGIALGACIGIGLVM